MNMLLSLLTCIALLFNGGAALPAQPETANVLTLSNVTLSVNDQTVTLNPSVEIVTQLGSEASSIHFEIKDADGVTRLPVSAGLDMDGALLALGSGERAYRYSAEAIEQALELDSLGDLPIDQLNKLLQSIAGLVSLENDPEAMAQLNEQVLQIFVEKLADQLTETQIEVNGQTLSGFEGDISFDSAAAYEMVDAVRTIEGPMADYCNAVLELENYILTEPGAAPISSYAELFSMMETQMQESGSGYSISDIAAPMHIVMAGNDKAGYSSLSMTLSVPDSDTQMTLSYNIYADENGGNATCEVNSTDNDTSTAMNFTADFTGPANAPTAMNVNGTVTGHSDYTWESTDENGEITTVGNITDTSVTFAMTATTDADGTEHTQLTIDGENTMNAASDYAYSEPINLSSDRTVAPTADGKHVTQSLELSASGIPLSLSYEADYAQRPAEDLFAGREIVDLSGENGEEAMNQLEMDSLSLMGDLTALSNDESVLALMQLFQDPYYDAYDTSDLTDYTVDTDDSVVVDDSNTDDEYDVPDDGTAYEMQQFATLEEAAAVYQGSMPDFTAPEGYTASDIQANADSLSIVYSCEDKPSFQLIASNYSYGYGYYTFENGALQPVSGKLVSTDMYDDGTVFCVDVLNGDDTLYFYFDDATLDDAAAILAGLN